MIKEKSKLPSSGIPHSDLFDEDQDAWEHEHQQTLAEIARNILETTDFKNPEPKEDSKNQRLNSFYMKLLYFPRGSKYPLEFERHLHKLEEFCSRFLKSSLLIIVINPLSHKFYDIVSDRDIFSNLKLETQVCIYELTRPEHARELEHWGCRLTTENNPFFIIIKNTISLIGFLHEVCHCYFAEQTSRAEVVKEFLMEYYAIRYARDFEPLDPEKFLKEREMREENFSAESHKMEQEYEKYKGSDNDMILYKSFIPYFSYFFAFWRVLREDNLDDRIMAVIYQKVLSQRKNRHFLSIFNDVKQFCLKVRLEGALFEDIEKEYSKFWMK